MELKNLVVYQEGQVVSKTLVQNSAVSVTLFAFEKDEEISTHESGGDAMVTVLEGTGRFTIDGREHILKAGRASSCQPGSLMRSTGRSGLRCC